jgi:GNAT superfamily N-acetyltransferase
VSRVVTLPDYQGLGLAFVLLEALGAEYASAGIRFRNYPAHPSFVRAHDRSKHWELVKQPGQFSSRNNRSDQPGLTTGGRACATFEYCGPASASPAIIS